MYTAGNVRIDFYRPPPTQDEILERMARKPNEADKLIGTCAICLDTLDTRKKVVELKCSPQHVFHLECLKTWA